MKAKSPLSGASLFPLFIAALILTGFGLYYSVHIKTQQEYLYDRNFRQLALIGNQLEGRIAGFRTVLLHVPTKSDTVHTNYNIRRYLTRANFQEVDSGRTPEELGITSPDDARNKRRWNRMSLVRSGTTIWIEFVDVDSARTQGWQTIDARVDLRQLVDPSVIQAVFDDILLVAPDGDVAYQLMRERTGIMRLDSLSDAQGKQVSFGTQKTRAGLAGLELAGISYDLFYRPIALPPEQHGLGRESEHQQDSGWSICGLVESGRLNKEARELPSTILIIVVLLLMLVSLSWPLLKVWLMGPYDRPTRVDVSFVIAALILGSTVLTFIILDFMYIRLVIEPQMDLHLEAFADSMNRRFDSELSSSVDQLTAFTRIRQRDSVQLMRKRPRYHANILNPASAPGYYPSVYQNFEVVFWADEDGKQIEKWSAARGTTPNLNVGERDYFRNIRQRNLYHVKGTVTGFAIEPHYSWTTGDFQLAVSILDTVSQRPRELVAVMDTRPASLMKLVTVPGYSFCIIDQDGRVMFHSVEARSLRENLFDELEPDDDLRAAVFAHSTSSFNASYWGAEQRVYVRPMTSLPWFIVVFRDKTPLRTSNLEILTGAVMLFLLFLAAPVLMLLFLTRKTQWTADWIWPHPRLTHAYRQLTVVYMGSALVLLLSTFHAADRILAAFFSNEVMICFLLYLTCVRLDRKRYRRLFGRKRSIRILAAASAVGLLVSIVLTILVKPGPASWLAPIPYVFLDASVFGVALLFFVTPRWWNITGMLTTGKFRKAYVANAMFITWLASVYPAYLFFGISYNVQAELLVKHAQRLIAGALHQRAAVIREDRANLPDSLLTRFLDDSTGVYTDFFFKTTAHRASTPDSCVRKARDGDEMYVLFHELSAPYNTRSTEMRELLHDVSADSSLVWKEDGALRLHSTVPGGREVVHLSTVVPTFLDWIRVWSAWSMSRVALYALMFGALAVVLYLMVRSIARRVLLIDVMAERQAPASPHPDGRTRRNILVLSSSPKPAVEILGDSSLHVIDIAGTKWKDLWNSLGVLRNLPADTAVAIDHFEEGMDDPAKNLRKLRLVEEILYVHRRPVILVSSVDPQSSFVLATAQNGDGAGSPDNLAARWRAILVTCTRMHCDDSGNWRKFARDLLGHHSERSGEQRKHFRFMQKTVFEECHHSAELQEIGRDVFAIYRSDPGLSPSEAVNAIVNRARLYYHHLWLACTADERRVLHHVALGGYVSYKNRAVVMSLQERGLLVRSPNLRVMSKGLLKFLLSSHLQEEVRRADAGKARTGWSTMRIPFFLLLVAVVLFLFVTQQDVLNSTMAFLSVVSALVPALFRFVGMATTGRNPAESGPS